jgi:CRISPR-associated exonuclease Cas4
MGGLGILILILGLCILWIAGRQREKTGLPGGRIIYTDTQDWKQVEQPLYSPKFQLAGKPDYLIWRGNAIIPVEVKTGRTPQVPYDSHIIQLAAYCLLVDQAYGKRPSHGIIKYPKRSYSVDYTSRLENELHQLLWQIRDHRHKRLIPRSHEFVGRCNGCGFRDTCDQKIK